METPDNVGNTTEELNHLLPNSNVLTGTAVNNCMWAVKFCTNKILKLLTAGAGKQVNLS